MRGRAPKTARVSSRWDYETLVQRLIRLLKETRVPYMFVGGIAVTYWGIPRTTLDIDLVIALESESIARLATALKTLQFDVRVDDLELIARVGNSFPAHTRLSPHRVDFWIPRTEFERAAFGRRHRVRLYERTAWMESPEDLILMKLLAGREKDWGDIAGVFQRQRQRLDSRYLHSWAKRLELTEALARLRTKRR